MAIRCSKCGREYDVTLFEFGHTVACECGHVVDLGLPPPDAARHRVTVYVKGTASCPLCEEALHDLQMIRRRRPFEMRVVAIETDPTLLSSFENDVPVVFVDGKFRFRGRVVSHILESLLD